MAATEKTQSNDTESVDAESVAEGAADPCTTKTDPTAPAGSASSLGAKSDCNGRPATDDSVVEAIDEEGPAAARPAARKPGS